MDKSKPRYHIWKWYLMLYHVTNSSRLDAIFSAALHNFFAAECQF